MALSKALILAVALLSCSQLGAATFGQFYDEWQDKHGHADRAAPEVVTSGAREVEAPKHEFGHGLFEHNKQAPAVATSGARDNKHDFGLGSLLHKDREAPAVATSGARENTHEFGHGLFNKQAPAVATSGTREHTFGLGHGLFNKQAPAVATSGAREHTFGLGGGLLGLRAPGAIVTPTATPANCKSVADLIQSPEFSTLNAAVEAAGLTSVLADPNLAATVFAPTNEAFVKALSDLSVKPEALLANKALLTSILQLHIIPGKALASGDLRDSKSYETLLKVDGKPVEVKAAVSSITKLNGLQRATSQIVSIVAPGGPSAQVVAADVNAGCPAVVHAIDYVLLPKN